MRRLLCGLLVAGLLLPLGLVRPAAAATVTTAAAPERWTTSVFARVPAPGYPAYVMAHRNGRVYAASYQDPGSRAPSRVFEWTAGGTLTRSWTVPGQVLTADHGVQAATQTRDGRLVLLETSRRAVMTLDLRTGRFRTIARLPVGSVPNYAAWGPGGKLYVTDYARGVLWRVGPRGGVQRWLTSSRLEGVLGFGTTGIAYRPHRRDLLVTQQTVADGSQSPASGALLSIPVRRDGRPGAVRTLWRSAPTDLPDGFGIGRSGRIYVANAGPTAQLVELTATGRELGRFPEVPLTGQNGSPIPFDTPCSATFLGTRVLVANQSAITGDASHQAVLAVEVGERGRAPYLPRSAGRRW